MDASGIRPTVVPQRSGTWPRTTLKFTINEARTARPGNAAMLGRLTELMFVEILREYAATSCGARRVARRAERSARRQSLAVVARKSRKDWSVDDLAREVVVSRSVLAQRFTELVGKRRCDTWPAGGCSSRSR